jgi:GMP synthase-like glutamine amidotransferase
MFHWHNDTFDLPRLPAPPNHPPNAPPPPAGSALLASSKLTKNQAFRFKTKLFGFQFHFEQTQADIERLVMEDRDSLIRAAGADAPSRVLEETKANYAKHERLGNRVIDNFVQFLKAY